MASITAELAPAEQSGLLFEGESYTLSPRMRELVALLLIKADDIDQIGTGSVEVRFDRAHVHRSLILAAVVNVDLHR